MPMLNTVFIIAVLILVGAIIMLLEQAAELRQKLIVLYAAIDAEKVELTALVNNLRESLAATDIELATSNAKIAQLEALDLSPDLVTIDNATVSINNLSEGL